MRYNTHRCALAIIVAAIVLAGCASEEEKKRAEFFTSGNPDADQRAEQRMAKHEQLKDSKSVHLFGSDADVSLYDRLGGQKGIADIVDDFVPRVLADPRVNWTRKGVKLGGFSIHRGRSVEWDATPQNVRTLKVHLLQFLSLSTGGPSEYSGKDMKQAHADMHITNAEFDAAVGDLKASLDKLKVTVKEQKELLSVVESTRTQVATER